MANPIAEALAPFVWGAGGSKKTPEQIAQEKEIAADILMRAGNTSPVGHWTQGAARVVDALGGVLKENRANAAGEENASHNQSVIAKLLSGQSAPATAPSAIPMTSAAGEASATSPGMQQYRDAIAGIESAGSGDYSAVGPTNDKLGRALGRYQIMEANIGPWSQAALGRAVTPEEFMADPKLQDTIFDHQFGQYVQKYGPEGAAQAWLGGEGGVGQVGRKDALGTSIGEYGNRFTSALGGDPQAAIEAVSPIGGSLTDEVAAFEQTPAYSEQFPGQQPTASPIGQQETVNTPQQAPMVQEVAQAQPAAQPSINPAIIEALSDPQATPQTRAIAQALLQQQQGQQEQAAQQQQWMERQRYEAQQQQADPLRQIQLQKGQLEIEQMRNPGVDGVAVGNRIVDRQTGKVIYEAPEGSNANFRRASPEEAQQYGAAAGQFGPDGRFYAQNPPQGTSLSVDPATGAVSFNQGAGVKPLTEAQGKDSFFATRMTAATPTLDKYEGALLSLGGAASSAIPMNLGNYLQSDEYQIAKDAGNDFVKAYLRKDSGAALTPYEEKSYGELLLPQPGDGKARVEAKRLRRQVAAEALKNGLPQNAVDNLVKTIKETGADKAQEIAPADSSKAPEGVDADIWSVMTPEERKLFQ